MAKFLYLVPGMLQLEDQPADVVQLPSYLLPLTLDECFVADQARLDDLADILEPVLVVGVGGLAGGEKVRPLLGRPQQVAVDGWRGH
jgi:hypothetical protein